MRLSITDVLKVELLQDLQDSLIKVCGVNLMMVDAEGSPVTRQTDPYRAGTLLVTPGARSRKSMSIHRKLCQENRITKRPAITTSPQTGLTTGAVPVFSGSRHLGSWVVGQIILSDADDEIILAAMLDNGVEEAEARALISKLPRMDKSDVERLFDFLDRMSHALLELSLERNEMASNYDQLKAMTDRLDSTAQMLTKLTNSADVGMYVSDFFTGEILQGNEQFARFLDKPLEELIGSPCWRGVSEEYEQFCPSCPHARLLGEKGEPAPPITLEEFDPVADRWTRLTHQAIYWVDGRLAHMVTMMDVTQNKKLQQELASFAFYDQMLGIPNALKLEQDVGEWRDDAPGSLICFDIISLRTINDVYSRVAGDALLLAICKWVQKLEIEHAQLYRIDGDEFCYAVTGVDRAVVLELANIIHRRFDDPWVLTMNGQTFNVFCSISLGVVHFGEDSGAGPDNVISIVERTLARSVQDGKPVVYGDQISEEYEEQLKLELSLKKAVMEGMQGFEVCYQPIIDPSTGTWCSLEALCRWDSPEFGPVAPVVFIHKAEQMGLITTVGNWVLDSAVRQCKEWGLDTHPHFILDVNLSPAQITDELLVNTVLGTLERYNYPGEKLSLEITESTELNFSNQTMGLVARLHDAGIIMALDDFGTGYSSFNNLKQLPVSLLKTERAFLDNIENDNYLQYLFHMMVELAHAAGMKVIAEGVETPGQMDVLLQNGVDYLQGYLFSPPLSAPVVEQSLDKFYQPSVEARGDRGRFSLKRALRDRDHYTMTTQHYLTLGQCAHILVSLSAPGEAVRSALGYLCGTLKLCRAYLYWRVDDTVFRKLFEWRTSRREPVDAERRLEQGDPLWDWVQEMVEYGMAVSGAQDERLSEPMHGLMQRMGTKATALLPMYAEDGGLIGIIGFDDDIYYRVWKPEEALLLHGVSEMLHRLVEKQHLRELLQDEAAVR